MRPLPTVLAVMLCFGLLLPACGGGDGGCPGGCDTGFICIDGACRPDADGDAEREQDGDPEGEAEPDEPDGPGEARRALSDSRFSFGAAQLGERVTRELIVESVGEATLYVNAIQIEQIDGAGYEAQAAVPLPAGIDPGDALSVVIGYTQGDDLPDTGSLLLSTNAPPFLDRIGLSSEFKGEPSIEVMPEGAAFGDLRVGLVGRQSFTILNRRQNESDSTILRIGAIELRSASSAVYLLEDVPRLPAFLVAGGSLAFSIRFTPNEDGRHSDLVTIVSSDPDRPRVEIPLSGTGVVPDIAAIPPRLDFGFVRTGFASRQTLELQNRGGFPLTVSRLALDPDGGPFAFDPPDLPAVVDPGRSLPVGIRFLPHTAGPAASLMLVESDDPESPVLEVELAGAGTTAEVAAGASELPFGQVRLGGERSLEVRINNLGQLAIPMESLLVEGDPAFSPLTPAADLAPLSSMPVFVSFAPLGEGVTAGSLVVGLRLPGDPGPTVVRVALTGEGVIQHLLTEPEEEIDFGEVQVGFPARQELTVRNGGGYPLALSSMTLTGDPAFSLEGDEPGTLPPHEARRVEVTCGPTSVGMLAGEVTIAGDDPARSEATVGLRAEGVDPRLTVDPAGLRFDIGERVVGSGAVTLAGALANGGSGTLTIGSIGMSSRSHPDFELLSPDPSGAPWRLAPGGSLPFAARYTPRSGGAATGGVTIVHDDRDSPLFPSATVALSAFGVTPDIQVSPWPEMAFGQVPLGDTSLVRTASIRNRGTGTLTVTGIIFTNNMREEFEPTAFPWQGSPLPLRPGDLLEFSFLYRPADRGSDEAYLSIASDDPDPSDRAITVRLTGTGASPNLPPVAVLRANGQDTAYLDLVPIGATVSLDGGGSSDPDGTVVDWEFSLARNPGGDALAGAGNSRTLVPSASGEYEVSLTAIDNGGDRSPPDSVTLRVVRAPTAVVRGYTDLRPTPVSDRLPDVVEPEQAFVTGLGSADLDGTIVSWEFACDISVPPFQNCTFAPGAEAWERRVVFPAGAGEYRIALTVTDNDGQTSSDWLEIEVDIRPTAVLLTDGLNLERLNDAAVNQSVILDSRNSFDDLWGDPTGIVSRRFDLDTSPPYAPTASLTPSGTWMAVFRASAIGLYRVVLTVTDTDGLTGEDSVVIEVDR